MSTVDLGPIVVGLAALPSQHGPRGGSTRSVSRAFASISEASPHTPINVREPAYLPGGVRLLNVTVLRDPSDFVIVTYEDAVRGTSLLLVQSTLDGNVKRTQLSVGDAIEETTVGSLPAAMIELTADTRRNGPGQTTLVWVKGETVYQAIGVGVSRSELVKVAESV